jgi:Flp pilus assembly protein TadG
VKQRIRQHKRSLAEAGGQALVEFATIATSLFLLLFGLMFVGNAVYRYNTMSNAAREAVRYAIVHSPTSPNPATNDQIRQVAINYATGVNLTANDITVTWPKDPNINNITNKTDAYDAQVQISYSYSLNVPFLNAVTWNLTSTSRMLVSQ